MKVAYRLVDALLRRVGLAREAKLISDFEKRLESRRYYSINYSEPDDIFITGYPKSGNTWMQHLITGLLLAIDTRYMPDSLAQEFVPDIHASEYYKRFLSTSVFKSHHKPKARYRRVIHLIRDPRDVMASYYSYNQSLGRDVTLKAMIENGEGLYPCR